MSSVTFELEYRERRSAPAPRSFLLAFLPAEAGGNMKTLKKMTVHSRVLGPGGNDFNQQSGHAMDPSAGSHYAPYLSARH